MNNPARDRSAFMANGPTRRAFLAAAALLSAATGKRNSSEASPFPTAKKPIRWLAFYGMTADEVILATYDIVGLDSAFQGSINLVGGKGTRVCGYLSLGEIRTSDPFLAFLDREALLPENPDWPGTRRVDVRHPSWRSLVLDRRIPSLASQGFTGLMFDTPRKPPPPPTVGPRPLSWHAGSRHRARGFHSRTLARNDAHHESRLCVVA